MTDQKAAEVCSQFYLGDGAKKLLSPDLSADQFIKVLIQKKEYVDAIRVLAYALSTTQAIAWAKLCADQFSRADNSEKFAAALAAVDQWLADPSDENRRSAMTAAQQAEFGTPAGSAALAVFLSGGSIAPPEMTPVEPAETMARNAVFNAVMLAALSREPEKAETKYQIFLAEGQKLAASQAVP